MASAQHYAETNAVTTTIKTEHPHIVRVPGVVGGRPAIKGTRISVDFLADLLEAGWSPQDILESYPHLTPAGVYDALSYYFDHQDEIDQWRAENTLEKLAERYNFVIEESGRIVFKRE
jgi:uncharacterized protein (DUF433 family)